MKKEPSKLTLNHKEIEAIAYLLFGSCGMAVLDFPEEEQIADIKRDIRAIARLEDCGKVLLSCAKEAVLRGKSRIPEGYDATPADWHMFCIEDGKEEN